MIRSIMKGVSFLGSRRFGKIEFPYKFGNVQNFQTNNHNHSMIQSQYLLEKCKNAYKSLLECIANEDMKKLQHLTEERLYKKIKNDYQKLKNDGYKFELLGKIEDTEVNFDSVQFIKNSYINRDTEINKEITIFKEQRLGEGASYLAYYQSERYITFYSLIFVNFSSSLRLNLIDPKGDSFLKKEDLLIPEVHRLGIEGPIELTLSVCFSSTLSCLFKPNFQALTKIKTATVVDLDCCLKGNPHKDSQLIY